jgi:hypothetical protein
MKLGAIHKGTSSREVAAMMQSAEARHGNDFGSGVRPVLRKNSIRRQKRQLLTVKTGGTVEHNWRLRMIGGRTNQLERYDAAPERPNEHTLLR